MTLLPQYKKETVTEDTTDIKSLNKTHNKYVADFIMDADIEESNSYYEEDAKENADGAIDLAIKDLAVKVKKAIDEKLDVEESEGVVVNLNLNKFNRGALKAMELRKPLLKGVQKGIQIIPNQLVTELCEFEIEHDVDNFEASLNDDILKIVYLNRYSADSVPQISYVRGFGIKSGAIASTVAHDSHNIMAVGTNDADLLKAINKVIEYKGGLVYCKDGMSTILPLPIGGIMSDRSGEYVNKIFTSLKRKVKREGATLEDPFMTLSFLSLIVIPEIKIGERGLFDFKSFSFIENCWIWDFNIYVLIPIYFKILNSQIG